jgi:pimeloyl-ACP methyl ester carboxylesterase
MRSHFAKAVLVVLFAVAEAPRAKANHTAPETVTFPLTDGNSMVGYHYRGHARKPLVVMLHGASDSHTVFDFSPGFRAARLLAAQGFSVLTVDRVGYGASTRPSGDTLDFGRSAGYVHEMIQAARAGALGFLPEKVVVLGPSAGADIAMVEAGTYHDVDGVIVCFNSSELQPAIFTVDVGAWLAQGDYFDFGVDFRTRFFYAEPWALPATIAKDNATRSLVPRAEILSALMNGSAPYRAQIAAPVFLLQADLDEIFVPKDDSALFSASTDVSYRRLHLAGIFGARRAQSSLRRR